MSNLTKIDWIVSLSTAVFVFFLLFWFTQKPSNDLLWEPDQQILPYATIQGNQISIFNIRNFSYRSTTDYDIHYYDKTYELKKLKKMYYIVEPFSKFRGAAHSFLSFEFEDDIFVSISVEIRKEKGESFSALKGLFKQYELMYVVGDEQDLVKLRANYRNDKVYVYPVKVSPDKIQQLFLSMIHRLNVLKDIPEFYNTLSNTCTTNIVSHVNEISPKRIMFDFRVLFPGYSDSYALELGLLDTSLPLEDARRKFEINHLSSVYADDPLYSVKIREFN